MERPWAAERVIDGDGARALVESQFPHLAPARLEALGAGWDNTAFLVNGTWVLRFPRRAIAAGLLEIEAGVLPAIAPRLPLAVPVPEMLGRPDRGFPWPFAGYRMLPGRVAAAAALDDPQRTAAAPALAAFLRALHAVPPEIAARAGAPPDLLRRLDVAHRAQRSLERLAVLEERRLLEGDAAREAAALRDVIAAAPASWAPRRDVLVHGDLDARHVLFDCAARPCGVIDWGDVHLGDPAVDLALAAGFFPPRGQEAFRASYGAIDEATWAVARLRAVHAGVTVLLWAHDAGDEALRRESLRWLRHAAEAAP